MALTVTRLLVLVTAMDSLGKPLYVSTPHYRVLMEDIMNDDVAGLLGKG